MKSAERTERPERATHALSHLGASGLFDRPRKVAERRLPVCDAPHRIGFGAQAVGRGTRARREAEGGACGWPWRPRHRTYGYPPLASPKWEYGGCDLSCQGPARMDRGARGRGTTGLAGSGQHPNFTTDERCRVPPGNRRQSRLAVRGTDGSLARARGGGQGGKTHSRASYGVQQAVLRVRDHANIMNAGGRGEQMSRSAPPAF